MRQKRPDSGLGNWVNRLQLFSLSKEAGDDKVSPEKGEDPAPDNPVVPAQPFRTGLGNNCQTNSAKIRLLPESQGLNLAKAKAWIWPSRPPSGLDFPGKRSGNVCSCSLFARKRAMIK
jgi:hypothetical protein